MDRERWISRPEIAPRPTPASSWVLAALAALALALPMAGQSAPTVDRPAPYPTYQVGDLGLMNVYGDPGQPVYLWRYKNGTPDGEQGRYIGTTNSSGLLRRESVTQPEWVGCYSHEQVAVGSTGNTRSTPLAYCVHAAAPPTTFRPGPFPSYAVGDIAIHEIHTDPAQPFQPVYRIRLRDGRTESNRIGTTDALGSLVLTLPLGATEVGTYTDERVSVGTPDGPRSVPLSYTVDAASPPAADRVDPHFPDYQPGDTATLEIHTTPPQPHQKVFRYRLLNGLPDGSQPTWIGTTDAAGFFTRSLPADGAASGTYSGERFAVGTPDGPLSVAMTYTVTGGSGGGAGGGSTTVTAPVVVRDAPFPNYIVGDIASLRLTTNPPQSGQVVYRFRYLNGAPDGAQPTAIGSTDAQGRFEISEPLATAQIGFYTGESFAVGAPDAPTSPALDYTVSADPATLVPPVAFRPQPYPNYSVGGLARLLLTTEPAQPNQPVYRFRLRDGVADGAQPTWIGTTDSRGTLEVSLPLGAAQVGYYTQERFAVGSPQGPTSQAMTYSVVDPATTLAAPSAVRTDAYFPNYTPGQVDRLEITTSPPRPGQPVYRFRQVNGEDDGPQPSLVGTTDATGSLLLETTWAEENNGTYTGEQFTVGSPAGLRSAAISFSVSGAAPGMRITGMSETEIAADDHIAVTVTGTELDTATTVEVHGHFSLNAPTATLISASPDGFSLEVAIDTTGADPGFYFLEVRDHGRHRGHPFRVVSRAPSVDAWSPSVPEQGETYVLTLLGTGLAAADIYPEDPDRVRVELVEQTDHRVLGLLHVEAGAPLGFTRLVLESSGGTTYLPLDIAAGTASGAATGFGGEEGDEGGSKDPGAAARGVGQFDLLEGSDLAQRAQAAGTPVPRLLSQGLQTSTEITAGKILGDDIIDAWCLPTRFTFTTAIHFPILLKTFTSNSLGEIGAIAAILAPGQSLNVSAFAVAITADLVLQFEAEWHSNVGWHMEVCYDFTLAVEIPGGGASLHSAGCSGQGSHNGSSTGTTTEASFLGGDCASTQPGPVIDGIGTSTITQDACCRQELGLTLRGTTFGTPFAVQEPLVGEVQADPSSCPCLPLVTTERYRVPPGNKGRLPLFTVQNLDETKNCTYDYEISRSGGTPTVALSDPRGSVTVPPSSSETVEIEIDIPVANNAADDATFTVEVTPRGTPSPAPNRSETKICLIPTGQMTTWKEWDDKNYPSGDVGLFDVRLLPSTTDFTGRSVSEQKPIKTFDNCSITGPAGYREVPFPLVMSGFVDRVGTEQSLDRTGFPPCKVKFQVQNQINCFGASPKDQQPYTSIQMIFEVREEDNKTWVCRAATEDSPLEHECSGTGH